MANVNSHNIDQRLLAHDQKVDEPTVPPSSPVFNVTFPSINTNILRINASPAFRLEIRIIATNTVELVAVPVVPEVETASSSPSPSQVPEELIIPDAHIPELNVSSPAELCAVLGTTEAPVLLAVQPPSPSYMDTSVQQPPSPISPPPPPPQTAEEHLDVLRTFVEKRQLSNFFVTESDDSEEFLVNVSSRAAELIKKLGEGSDIDAQNSFLANPETVADVAKLSLYDHILFCGKL